MTVVVDEDGCRMWIDDFSPILFIKFSEMPSLTKGSNYLTKKCKSAWNQLTNKFDCLYTVIDTSACTNECAVKLVTFCLDHLPLLLGKEMKYFAVVTPPAVSTPVHTHLSLMMKERTRAQCGCFNDFFVALGQVNSIRQQVA